MPETPRQCLGLSSGFTLIEILVVIVILGITTVLATANLFQTAEEKLQQESEKLLAVLQIARDEAAFGGRVIAVTITGNEIQFLERDFADPSRWNASAIEGLRPHTLSDTFSARLRVGSASADAKDNIITFLPIGVAAPFELALSGPAGNRKIAGDAIGNLRLGKDPS
ncbi:MAG: GspH/FimT family pseudopilin [Betaproteobacteria bacterium]|nr:GspH/FimT family pseudopilin [Betaproteobacteria bacterium]